MTRTDKVKEKKKVRRTALNISVRCEECGKAFKTRSMLPTCPRCGGVDIVL